MDELACPSSSCSARSPSFFSTAGGHQPQPPVLEFESCDIPEQWLEDDECLDTLWGSSLPASAGNNLKSDNNKPLAKRRGRKPGSRNPGSGPAAVLNHVEAERQRRDKLNRRFYDLRAAVPTVSKMDRASILADATAYIAELRRRVELLEVEARQQAAAREGALSAAAAASSSGSGGLGETLEVRMLGCQAAAALRMTTAAAERHAPARLMAALCWLDLPVQHASVCRVGGGVTVQDAVVEVPAALRDEGRLRAALLHRLQGSG